MSFKENISLYFIQSDRYKREYSILTGLIPPEEEAKKMFVCDHSKALTSSSMELELARRQHRWPEMNTHYRKFFEAVADKVTEYESDILSLFGLSAIEDVRASLMGELILDGGAFTEYQSKMAGLKRIFNEWQVDLIGNDDVEKDVDIDDFSIMDFFLLSAFGLSLKRIYKKILSRLPPFFKKKDVPVVSPDINDPYLQAIIADAGRRIRKKLGKDNIGLIRQALKEMVEKGTSKLDAAKWLHIQIGEGQLWYWNRIIRSESVLSMNAAYNAQANAAGVKFDQWRIQPGACVICVALDSQIWKRGEGPEPVLSTHPHCQCIREALYVAPVGLPIQPKWDQPSPYKS